MMRHSDFSGHKFRVPFRQCYAADLNVSPVNNRLRGSVIPLSFSLSLSLPISLYLSLSLSLSSYISVSLSFSLSFSIFLSFCLYFFLFRLNKYRKMEL